MLTKPMRAVFGETLCELGAVMPNLVVLDCDTSSSTQTKLFGEKYEERFYNFGIAEANMVSAAAGMAVCGLIPVASAFAFLLALRAGDPVRSLIAYNRLNVKLAGGYAGLSDFADGASHQSVTDIAVMRAMPHMTVLVPSDMETTRGALRAALTWDGPVYIRLSRHEVASYHENDESFQIGTARCIKEGRDITVAVSGTLLSEVLAAEQALSRQGLSVEILEFPTIKPFDGPRLQQSVDKTGAVVTVEEHSIIGGLGSAVAEYLSEHRPVLQKRIGLRDVFGGSGSYTELLDGFGLSARHIEAATLSLLDKKRCLGKSQ